MENEEEEDTKDNSYYEWKPKKMFDEKTCLINLLSKYTGRFRYS